MNYDEYEPKSKLWNIRDVGGNYDIGKYEMGSVKALVTDCDGDGTIWSVHQNGKLLQLGEIHSHAYAYNFQQGIKAVEDVLIEIGWLVG